MRLRFIGRTCSTYYIPISVLVTARRLDTDTVTVRVQPAVVIGVWRGESDSESECVRPTVRWQRSVGLGQCQLISQTLLKWFWISNKVLKLFSVRLYLSQKVKVVKVMSIPWKELISLKWGNQSFTMGPYFDCVFIVLQPTLLLQLILLYITWTGLIIKSK